MKRLFNTLLSFSLLLALYPSFSFAFQANYAKALQDTIYFFDAQRSGQLSTSNRVPWRGDSALKDAKLRYPIGSTVDSNPDHTVDLSGGYYDAGDNIKYGYPFAFTTTNLAWSLIEFQNSYVAAGQYNYAVNNLRWATDYLLKAWQPGSSIKTSRLYAQVGRTDTDHDYYYMPYEVLDIAHKQKGQERRAYYIDGDQYLGSDLAGSTAAALAASSIVFKNIDSAYSSKLLTSAKQVYAFAQNKQSNGKAKLGFYSDAVAKQGDPQIKDAYGSIDYSSPLSTDDRISTEVRYIGLAAVWLYKATGESKYFQEAITYLPSDERSGSNSPCPGTTCPTASLDTDSSNWSNNSAAAFVLLANLQNNPYRADYQYEIENWIAEWKGTSKTPGGLLNASDDGNLSYIVNMTLPVLVYSKNIANSESSKAYNYRQFVKSQIDYILGNNPMNLSYLVGYQPSSGAEGAWPDLLQHATAQGAWAGMDSLVEPTLGNLPDRHVDYGALVGGPDRSDRYCTSKNLEDAYCKNIRANDFRDQYQQTETGLDYVVGLQGTLAGLNMLYPGQPAANFPGTPIQQNDEYYVSAKFTDKSNPTDKTAQAKIRVKFYNHSASPARVIYQQSFRVYLNLGEHSTSKVKMTSKSGNTQISQLTSVGNGIYYFLVTVTYPMYPGGIESVGGYPIPSIRTMDLTISMPFQHDFQSDWSLQSLNATQMLVDVNMPVYGKLMETSNFTKLAGSEPSLPG